MPGVKGRSGGHNRKAAQVHALLGTSRSDRPWTVPATAGAHVLPMPAPQRRPVAPPAGLLRGLGAAGRRLVRDVFSEYETGPTETHVLRQAAEALDDRVAARVAGDPRAARQAGRAFLQALQRLGLPAPRQE